jgi:hypothetical protein
MTNDLDDDQLAAQAQAAAEQQRQEELGDLGIMLDTQAGRRVLRRILERAGLFRSPFHPDSERISSKRAGEQVIGLWLLDQLAQARPDAIGGLIVEVQKPAHLDAPRS